MIKNPKIGDKVWAVAGSDGDAKIIEDVIGSIGYTWGGTLVVFFDRLGCMRPFTRYQIFPSLESLIEDLQVPAIFTEEETL